MAETIDALGFDLELSDRFELDEPKFSHTAEGKKRAALNIAKSARKARKGERRARGTTDKPKPGARTKR